MLYGSRFLNYYTNSQIKNALTELGLQLYPWKEQSVQQLFLLQVEAELPFEFPLLHMEILWAMNIIKTVCID